jgi:hypothetical protein
VGGLAEGGYELPVRHSQHEANLSGGGVDCRRRRSVAVKWPVVRILLEDGPPPEDGSPGTLAAAFLHDALD